ncbi:MAG: chemotaxis response regulator protein-glutamate methylesterase [Acidobacteriaceae bacterium]|nr:chemotaxis response regulator protein-glutamate methylesterase [Acidobacteriaceae bacterium]
MTVTRRIKVLVVDDSAVVRKLLSEAIGAESDLEVAGTAPDAYVARDKILALKPDVLTLDIEMPRMDGLTFLKKLMQYHPMPVIVISSLGQASCESALEALRLGAVEVIAKPGGPYSVGELATNLADKIRAAAAARVRRIDDQVRAPQATERRPPAPSPRRYSDKLIAIGASTGGTEAIQQVLMGLPADCPPIVITQHIPPVFSKAFADRLNQICPMQVKEAEDGETLQPGRALIAPGNFHMVVRGAHSGGLRIEILSGPAVCFQRPSVDVMFSSVADIAGARALGVLLTGMGSDGAQGLLRMKKAGARTIAQDEASSVVFGMPREAIQLGAVDQVIALPRIASAILGKLSAPTYTAPITA